MQGVKKEKVSITISRDVLQQVDAYAAQQGIGNRSQVIELWLRQMARQQRARQLEKDTIDYYESLTNAELVEDVDWASVSTAELARLDLD